ncbi:MAG: M16 family metallopeptidase [Ornithinimicrobium sp.]|uniref:M16 family metallopeptidase n=1 Tax=Ornithinimicrobium sp. TaxID=1977084 RepID=UPI003D9ACC81
MSVEPVPARPEVSPPAPWSFPPVTETRLPTGLAVRTVDLPGQHVVAVRLAVPGTLQAEPRDLEGVAAIMARCLDEGTTRHTAEQMAERIEQDGIALAAGVGERGLVVQLDVTGDRLESALQILAECLSEATFPEAEVTRAIRARLSDIEHEQADAGSRAATQFQATYLRASERTSRPAGGTATTVRRVSAADVREFYAATVVPHQATLVVAGDLRGMPRTPEALAAQTLAGWAGSGADPARNPGSTGPRPDPRAPDAARIVLVDRPGSPQTELYLGRPGPDRRTPHGWGAYQVLAFLLGGSPQARVDAVLREERGWTYGMRVGFAPRRSGGVSVVSGAVRADATVPALRVLDDVLSVTGTELSEAEVRHAADFVARTAPGRYATADAVADQLVRLALDELDADTVDDTLAQVLALRRDEVAAAWEEVQAGPPWTVVLVGEAEHAPVAELEQLGWGPVVVLPAD